MAVKPLSGLGRGLDALIPTDFDESILSEPNERIQKLALGDISANPDQPRKTFDEATLKELANSIERYGILQPIVVTKNGDKYIIIAGERRYRASKLAGLPTIPVIVRSHKELEQLEIALIENVQRVDLSPLEQAQSIERLHDQFSMTYESIAARLGKAPTTINNIVRLLQLPEPAKNALRASTISEGHARSLLALKDMPDKQVELLDSIVRYAWSVRQAEQFVTSTKQGAVTPNQTRAKMATSNIETKQLSTYLQTPVSLRRTAKGGRLELHFKSDEDLNRIIKRINTQ